MCRTLHKRTGGDVRSLPEMLNSESDPSLATQLSMSKGMSCFILSKELLFRTISTQCPRRNSGSSRSFKIYCAMASCGALLGLPIGVVFKSSDLRIDIIWSGTILTSVPYVLQCVWPPKGLKMYPASTANSLIIMKCAKLCACFSVSECLPFWRPVNVLRVVKFAIIAAFCLRNQMMDVLLILKWSAVIWVLLSLAYSTSHPLSLP